MHSSEDSLIRAFILPHRKARWRAAIASKSRRRSFLDRLNHCRDLDERFITPLPRGEGALVALRSRGAGKICHVVSAVEGLDGRDLPLTEALEQTEAGGWGTLICCIPGRLAYYHDELGSRRLVLDRADG